MQQKYFLFVNKNQRYYDEIVYLRIEKSFWILIHG